MKNITPAESPKGSTSQRPPLWQSGLADSYRSSRQANYSPE